MEKIPSVTKLKSLTRADQEARLSLLITAIREETDVMRRLAYIQERLNLEKALTAGIRARSVHKRRFKDAR